MNFRKIVLWPVIIGILLFPTLAAGETVIQTGGTFFIGEGNLDVIPAFYGTDTTHQQNLTWFHAINPGVNHPEGMLKIPFPSPPPEILSQYTAVPSDWRGYFGGWNRGRCSLPEDEDCTLAFYVQDPMIDISVIDAVNQTDISGKSVKAGTPVDFIIRSNLYLVAHDQNRSEPTLPSKGFIDIKVISPSGELLTSLPDTFGTQKNLTGLYVDTNPYLWGKGAAWDTAQGTGNLPGRYPPGTYTIWAESTLNQMKENYPDPKTGNAYIGKTVTLKKTVVIEPFPSPESGSDPVAWLVHMMQQAVTTIRKLFGMV